MPLLSRYDAVLLKKRFCGGSSFWPRISEALALRLSNAFLARSGLINTWRIMDELRWLEQTPDSSQTPTKPAAPLSGEILGRFMHKHYTSAAFLVRNIQNQWFEGYGKKHKLLAAEIANIVPVGYVVEDEGDAWKKAGQIAHIAALEGYKRRANRQQLTGEWIVYYVHNGQNYYLDIAFHDEASTPEGEQALYNRLALACQWEFPFAFDS